MSFKVETVVDKIGLYTYYNFLNWFNNKRKDWHAVNISSYSQEIVNYDIVKFYNENGIKYYFRVDKYEDCMKFYYSKTYKNRSLTVEFDVSPFNKIPLKIVYRDDDNEVRDISIIDYYPPKIIDRILNKFDKVWEDELREFIDIRREAEDILMKETY